MNVAFQILTAISAVLAWHFVLAYATGSNWRETEEGRALMYLGGSIALILTSVTATQLLGDYPGRQFVVLGVYGSLPVTLGWLNVVLKRAQKENSDREPVDPRG